MGIDWSRVTWQDLRKPLFSGIAAAMYATIQSGAGGVPNGIEYQAVFWKNTTRPLQEVNVFYKGAQKLETGKIQNYWICCCCYCYRFINLCVSTSTVIHTLCNKSVTLSYLLLSSIFTQFIKIFISNFSFSFAFVHSFTSNSFFRLLPEEQSWYCLHCGLLSLVIKPGFWRHKNVHQKRFRQIWYWS